MFELNPYHLPYADLLHVVMLLGTAFLAYSIGQTTCRERKQQLERELKELLLQLAAQRRQPIPPPTSDSWTGSDDLEENLGVNAAVKQMLSQQGIRTFKELGAISTWTIQQLLTAHGPANHLYDPATWPTQARLAAENRWRDLRAYQEQMRRGAPTDLFV